MRNIYAYFMLALFAIFYTSCLDEIDLPIPRGFEPIVVIQGTVVKSKNTLAAKVFISNSSSKDAFSQLIRVSSVILENDKGHKVQLTEGQDGSYNIALGLNSPTFDSKSSTKYRLTVTDFKKNIYQSSYEPIIEGATLSNPKFSVVTRNIGTSGGGKDEVKYFTSKVDINRPQNTGNIYKFDYELSYAITEGKQGEPRMRTCYVTNLLDLKGANIQDLKTLSPDKYKDYPAVEIELDYRFAEQSYVSIIIGTITSEVKDYFEQQNQLRSKDVNIFQPQGERLNSNFVTTSNPDVPIVGYFYGSFQDTVRMKVTPASVGNPPHVCPTTLNEQGECNFPQCCNCTQLKGSSTLRPSFWF